MEENQGFEYTYSAPEQKEVKRIRDKYLPREKKESKLERLRRLDRQAERPGTAWSIAIGVVGCLLLGTGLSCTTVMTEYFLPGIVIGIIGLAVIALAYPVYQCITRREREKIAPEILKLSEEIERGI